MNHILCLYDSKHCPSLSRIFLVLQTQTCKNPEPNSFVNSKSPIFNFGHKQWATEQKAREMSNIARTGFRNQKVVPLFPLFRKFDTFSVWEFKRNKLRLQIIHNPQVSQKCDKQTSLSLSLSSVESQGTNIENVDTAKKLITWSFFF